MSAKSILSGQPCAFPDNAVRKNEFRKAMNNCPALTCMGSQPVLLIESAALQQAGHQLVAIVLVQQAMTAAGIDWTDQSSALAVIRRWLRVEFFDSPQLLRAIMELLSGVASMEWISELIRTELTNYANYYRNQNDMSSVQGGSSDRIDRIWSQGRK